MREITWIVPRPRLVHTPNSVAITKIRAHEKDIKDRYLAIKKMLKYAFKNSFMVAFIKNRFVFFKKAKTVFIRTMFVLCH